MDRKELIYKFSEETGEKVHAQLPDMGSYNDKYVYWLEQQVKNCSIPDVMECLEQVNTTLERHGKVEANTDLHNKIRNTL